MSEDFKPDLVGKLEFVSQENGKIIQLIEETKSQVKRLRLERALILEKIDDVQLGSSKPNTEQETAKQPAAEPADTQKRAQPPKAPNAYTIYCREERENIQNKLKIENPETTIKPAMIQKRLSEQWKQLSKQQKQPYANKARVIKENQRRSEPIKEEIEEADVDKMDNGNALSEAEAASSGLLSLRDQSEPPSEPQGSIPPEPQAPQQDSSSQQQNQAHLSPSPQPQHQPQHQQTQEPAADSSSSLTSPVPQPSNQHPAEYNECMPIHNQPHRMPVQMPFLSGGIRIPPERLLPIPMPELSLQPHLFPYHIQNPQVQVPPAQQVPPDQQMMHQMPEPSSDADRFYPSQ